MTLIERLIFVYRNIKSKFVVGLDSVSYEKQVEILHKYKPDHNNNNSQRSYSQFLCHIILLNSAFYILLNLLMIIPLMILPLLFILMRIFYKRKKSVAAIYFYKLEIIPKVLIDKYNFEKNSNLFSMGYRDLFYFNHNLWKHPFSFYYNFTILMRLANMSHNVYVYKPKVIINNLEYSFTSSILTEYLNKIGIEHINVMHGEKLFNIRDAYANFNKFYVWDYHYVELFCKLGYNQDIFRVEKPQSLLSKCGVNNSRIKNQNQVLKYFLNGSEEFSQQKKLIDILEKLNKRFKIVIRLHPRYSTSIEVFKKNGFITIEYPNLIEVKESICESDVICSQYSTVLYQAYLLNKTVIIDDVSDVNHFNSLKQLDYIMIELEQNSKSITLLSTLLI